MNGLDGLFVAALFVAVLLRWAAAEQRLTRRKGGKRWPI
jgi:hypothetical protein